MMHATRQRRDTASVTPRSSAWSPVQAKLIVGAPGDRHEAEADRAADAVMNGAPVTVGGNGPASVRRDPPVGPPAPAGASEALQKLGEAFLKTQVGKQLVDAAERLGQDFVATLPGKVVTGAAAVAAVAELAREHKALPMQPPAVPLDFLTPGLKAQIRIDGPIDHPSGASIAFTIPLGGGGSQASLVKAPPASAAYRAETARMQQDMDKWRPKPAADPLMDAYTKQQLTQMTERLIPGLRPRSAIGIQPEKKDDGPVQRKAQTGDTGPAAAPASLEGVLGAGGEQLPRSVQATMSSRFGHDFSGVRVHADDRAAASASAIGARAYAYRDHIVFGRGQYAPARREGQWLLAHELAHVAQQTGRVAASPIAIGRRQDTLERHADRAADQVMAMPGAMVTPNAVPHIMRKCEACEAEDEAESLHAKSSGGWDPIAGSAAPDSVHQVLRGSGAPLDAGTRAFFEPRFGRDFSNVRVHADTQAAESAQQVGARAYTVGNRIAFGAGEWSPATQAGRTLLAHELAHVVQHRHAPTASLRRDTPEVAHASNAEMSSVGMSVSLSGLEFSVPASVTYAAGRRSPQLLAIVLKRLLGPEYKPGLEKDVEAELNKAKESRYGGFRQSTPAKAGEAIGPIRLGLSASILILDYLAAKKIKTVLSDQQTDLLRLGVGSVLLWDDFKQQLSTSSLPLPRWYTAELFQMEVASQAGLLRAYTESLKKERAGDDKAHAAKLGQVTDVITALYHPIEVMEAVRLDVKLSADPKTSYPYGALWKLPKDGTLKQPPTAIQSEASAELFLGYQRTQPQLMDKADYEPEARHELMVRFGGYLQRTLYDTPMSSGDQQLSDKPALANAPAFPASMAPVPDLSPPLYNAALGTDHRFGMSVQFPSVYEALGNYAFGWERLRVPESQLGQPIDVTKMRGEKVSNWDVAAVRFSRDVAYAEADISRTIASVRNDLGPPGVGALELVGANAILRFVGEGIKTMLDLLTMPQDQKLITFPTAGLYMVRASMSLVASGNEAVVRPPSVAYYPVLARDPDEMAATGVKTEATARERTETEIKALEKQLAGPMDDKERAAAQKKLDALKVSIGPLGGQLEARLKKAADLEKATAADYRLGDPEIAKKQRESVEKVIALRKKRDVTDGQVVSARFVSDLGQQLPLTLEVADRPAPKGSFSIYVSDLTTPKSGDATGSGPTREDAIAKAIQNVLESIHGYGRGRVAIALGKETRTVRIEAGQGALLMEAVENVATALSVAAIAAAPLTGGASLSFLIPLGLVGAVPSAYRVVQRLEAGTFEFNLENALDLVNIAGSLIGIGRIAAGSMRSLQLGRTLLVVGYGVDAAGALLMGANLIQQINELAKLPPGERASALTMLLGQTLMSAGIMAGGALQERVQQAHAEASAAKKTAAGEAPRTGAPEPHPAAPPASPEARAQARTDADLAKLGKMDKESEARLRGNEPLRNALAEEPRAAAALKKCASDCFPPGATADQVHRLERILEAAAKTGDYDQAKLKDYFYARRGDLNTAIGELEGLRSAGELNAFLDAAARARMAGPAATAPGAPAAPGVPAKGAPAAPGPVPPTAPRPAAPSVGGKPLEPGARVKHPAFGDGQVVSIKEGGKIEVLFDDGRKATFVGDRITPSETPLTPTVKAAAEEAFFQRQKAKETAERTALDVRREAADTELLSLNKQKDAKSAEAAQRRERGQPTEQLSAEIRKLNEQIDELQIKKRGLDRAAENLAPTLYEAARRMSPNDEARRNVKQKANRPDGLPVGPNDKVTPDHTVPVVDIVKMTGFAELDPAAQSKILNWDKNLVPMDQSVNSARGSKSWHEWLEGNPYDQPTRERMRGTEDRLRVEIQQKIFEALGRGTRP